MSEDKENTTINLNGSSLTMPLMAAIATIIEKHGCITITGAAKTDYPGQMAMLLGMEFQAETIRQKLGL